MAWNVVAGQERFLRKKENPKMTSRKKLIDQIFKWSILIAAVTSPFWSIILTDYLQTV
jgi:hypothetical protein